MQPKPRRELEAANGFNSSGEVPVKETEKRQLVRNKQNQRE